LLATMPADLGHVMLTCTGSEANDLATRIARHWTGNAGFIVTRHAYHGTTAATALLSPSLDTLAAESEVVELVDPPERLSSSPEDASAFGRRVAAAVAALSARGIRPAALIVDSLLASDGVVPNPAGFLGGAADAIREAGGLLIVDEVQAGFGRTGTMWGFERHSVVPDIVTMGKPMGNGYPVAGLAARPDLVDSFGKRARYFNTFAGSPVACAVGMAVLDVLEDEGLVARARELGARLLARLQPLAECEFVRDVRGAGLFIALEIQADSAPGAPTAAAIVDRMRQSGVLAGVTGPGSAVVKIRPSLAFTADDMSHLVDVLYSALK
jgi:4-aminobutyrate aminotransferase-like enzyme